jgi:hypothetical protein
LRRGAARQPVDRQRLGERLPHGHAGVERAVGILEHDLHAAAQRAQRAGVERQHVLAIEGHAAGVRLDQPEDSAAHGGLAAPRLAHEPERLPRGYCERYAVHGAHRGVRPAQAEQPALAAKVLDEPVDLDQWGRHARAVRRAGSVSSQQRTVWVPGSPVLASSNGGSSWRQRSQAYGQRG